MFLFHLCSVYVSLQSIKSSLRCLAPLTGLHLKNFLYRTVSGLIQFIDITMSAILKKSFRMCSRLQIFYYIFISIICMFYVYSIFRWIIFPSNILSLGVFLFCLEKDFLLIFSQKMSVKSL